MNLSVRSMFSIKELPQPVMKEVRHFDFIVWIGPTGEIHVLAIELQYIFAEIDRQLLFQSTSYDLF